MLMISVDLDPLASDLDLLCFEKRVYTERF